MFILDSRLSDSSIPIVDLVLSQVRLKNNQLYPWIILVPKRAGITELHELSLEDQQTLIQEIAQVSAAMKSYFKAHKINCGALGNIVSQLHIHVIARYQDDASWPHSVWQPGVQDQPYESLKSQELIRELAKLLGLVCT